MEERTDDEKVEPLLAALGRSEPREHGRSGRLVWKLLGAALVLLALLVLVLKQAF